MNLFERFRSLFSGKPSTTPRRTHKSPLLRPSMERLEDRSLMAYGGMESLGSIGHGRFGDEDPKAAAVAYIAPFQTPVVEAPVALPAAVVPVQGPKGGDFGGIGPELTPVAVLPPISETPVVPPAAAPAPTLTVKGADFGGTGPEPVPVVVPPPVAVPPIEIQVVNPRVEASFDQASGRLSVTGTESGDQIKVTQYKGSVTVRVFNSDLRVVGYWPIDIRVGGETVREIDADSIRSIVVDAGGGNDTVLYEYTTERPSDLRSESQAPDFFSLIPGVGAENWTPMGTMRLASSVLGRPMRQITSTEVRSPAFIPFNPQLVGPIFDPNFVERIFNVEMTGGDGEDRLEVIGLSPGTLNGGDEVDHLYGGEAGDTLSGGEGDDWLYGRGGSDTIWGLFGSDHLYGGAGVDRLFGDSLDPALGDSDYIVGGTEGDYLFGGGGVDKMFGDEDTDPWGGTGDDHLYGGAGNDDMAGQGGNDFLYGDGGNDTLYGNDGNDTMLGDGETDGVSGGTGNDYLYGGAGNDDMAGQGGNDFLFGEGDTDSLYGNAGDDWLDAGSAGETADGGLGVDWNPHVWAVGGASAVDINQGQTGSCAFLAALAAASKYRDLAANITYEGNYIYSVRMYDPDREEWVIERVQFDGTIVRNAMGQVMDATTDRNATGLMDNSIETNNNGKLIGTAGVEEYWMTLYQRAYLQRFRGVNVFDANALGALGGETDARAMEVLIGDDTEWESWGTWFMDGEIAPSWLAGKAASELVIVGGTGHRYMVDAVFGDGNGGWLVRMYNPWGVDGTHNGMSFIADGNRDGFITVTWAAFENGLDTVWYT